MTNEEVRDCLGNLLAIIHRDGGHHTAKVGWRQSVDDAHEIWARLQTQASAVPEHDAKNS